MRKVLVVGDIILDQYTFVRSDRSAQEADIPVWDEQKNEFRLGGAANVANNIKALGGDDVTVWLAGVAGRKEITSMLDVASIGQWTVGSEQSTMVKRRFVNSFVNQYVMRLDNFQRFDIDDLEIFEQNFEDKVRDLEFDAVVFSDYNKGTISRKVVDMCRPLSKLVVVDSKRIDLSIYDGLKLLKLNEGEYSTQVSSKQYPNVTKFFEYVVVTRGAQGADLLQCEREISDEHRYVIHRERFPAEKVVARDVTGAGDTHTAAMAFSMMRSDDIRMAIKFANHCSAKKVQQFGTSVIK